MNLSKMPLALTGCFLAALLPGCLVVAGGSKDPDPEPIPIGEGSLTVDVSIDGSHSPSRCVEHDVDQIEISLSDDFGPVKSVSVDCELFGVTFEGLSEGFYAVDIDLVDFDGFAVETSVTVEELEVIDGQDTKVEVKF